MKERKLLRTYCLSLEEFPKLLNNVLREIAEKGLQILLVNVCTISLLHCARGREGMILYPASGLKGMVLNT